MSLCTARGPAERITDHHDVSKRLYQNSRVATDRPRLQRSGSTIPAFHVVGFIDGRADNIVSHYDVIATNALALNRGAAQNRSRHAEAGRGADGCSARLGSPVPGRKATVPETQFAMMLASLKGSLHIVRLRSPRRRPGHRDRAPLQSGVAGNQRQSCRGKPGVLVATLAEEAAVPGARWVAKRAEHCLDAAARQCAIERGIRLLAPRPCQHARQIDTACYKSIEIGRRVNRDGDRRSPPDASRSNARDRRLQGARRRSPPVARRSQR